LANYENKKSFS